MPEESKSNFSIEVKIPLVEKLLDLAKYALGAYVEPKKRRSMAIADSIYIEKVSESLSKSANQNLRISLKDGQIAIESYGNESESHQLSLIERTQLRLNAIETRRQENIESVFEKAFDEVNPLEVVDRKKIDDSWVHKFIDSVHDVSDEELQHLWAKILGEENRHGNSFSIRAMSILNMMSRDDLECFLRVCQFVTLTQGSYYSILIQTPYRYPQKLDYSDIMRCQELGLLATNSSTRTYLHSSVPFGLAEYGKKYMYFVQNITNSIILDEHVLTGPGSQLFKFAEFTDNESARDNIVQCLKSKFPKVFLSNSYRRTGDTIQVFQQVEI